MNRRRTALRGFTLFELVVVVVVVSVLAAAFVRRLAVYQELAEKAAMDYTLNIVKMALQIRLANLMTDNRQNEATELERTNPMQWLSDKPPNYLGRYRKPTEQGSWYYDERRLQLVYIPRSADFLRIDNGREDGEIRFRTRLIFDAVDIAGMRLHSVTGVALTPVRPYRWTPAITRGLWS